ncbi:hypothetical protein AAC387_Pa05g0489 [Persea americana]
MAARNRLSKPTYRFFSENPVISDSQTIEFDESDVWNSPPLPVEPKIPIPSSRIMKKSSKRADSGDRAASSLPLNIPDWSKILREDYRDSRRGGIDGDSDDEEEEESDGRIPPHEFLARQLARTRIASFSVHEGVGRTLKGRDLSRVRNAIWEKTGFED